MAFSDLSAFDLADAFLAHPIILKPVLAACNCGARAIERDLGIRNIDTYQPRLSKDQTLAIAAYIKPFLPEQLALPALSHLDRISYIDKEIRLRKGRWEQMVKAALNRLSGVGFRKRRFVAEGERFEIDAAAPPEGPIRFGVDVKRIEARRDIHKRTDEIANKARRLRQAFRQVKVGAVIYYPFVAEHVNVQNRLGELDAVAFAGESTESIESAVGLLLAKMGVSIRS